MIGLPAPEGKRQRGIQHASGARRAAWRKSAAYFDFAGGAAGSAASRSFAFSASGLFG
jgi:hypothetical protein